MTMFATSRKRLPRLLPPSWVGEWVVLAIATLLLTACSFTKLAYMNAPLAYSNATPVLTYMAADYADLSGEQKEWVRERIDKAMAWHRAQELPEYRRFLEDLLARADGPLTVEDARYVQRTVRARYHRALDYLAPDIADLLLQLDDEQVGQLEKRFAKDNRKFLEESLDLTREERSRRSADKYIEHIEEWVGGLTDAQRDLIYARVATFGSFPEDQLADRRYRQGAIVALARTRPPRDRMVAELRRLLVDTDSWRRAEYREKVRLRDERVFQMFADLGATITPEQRAALRERLRGFMRDVNELTARND